jgi:hypothetical protein
VLDQCTPGDTTCPAYQQGVSNQTAANVAAGLTAAVGVFTIVAAFATDWGGKKGNRATGSDPSTGWAVRSGTFSLRPTFTVGSGATLGATGTF